MKTIKVFPDYMSTGLWLLLPDDEAFYGYSTLNIEPENISHVVPKDILIALKYWHHVWELMQTVDGTSTMSENYKNEWWQDGLEIVAAMNQCQKEFNFVYDVERNKL